MAAVVQRRLSSLACFTTVLYMVCCCINTSSSATGTEFRCPGSSNCSCSKGGFGYELFCPPVMQKPMLTVQIKRTDSLQVQIQCLSNDVDAFSLVNGLHIGNINYFMIRLCPLPTMSLKELMKSMGITNVSHIQIISHGNFSDTVRQQLFEDLFNVTSLSLNTNGITLLPEDIFKDVPNLTLLDFKNNNINFPKNIFRYVPKLEVLELGGNNLTHLETGVFRNLTHLRLLNLWGNLLRNLSRSVFSDIPNLESLDINSNKLTGLRPDLFADLTKLKKINLYANEFISLPTNLFINNPELETVYLQDNRRTLKTLPPGLLSNLTKLKDVKLHVCNISNLPEDLLWGSTSIMTLTLDHNFIETLPTLLFKDARELQSLDLSYNQIAELPNKLFSNADNLKTLKLNNNRMTTITEYLFTSLKKLEYLDLKDNKLKQIERNSFLGVHSLRTLNMSNNMLSFDEYSNQGDGFGARSPLQLCNALEDLQLANNSFTTVFVDWRLSMNALRIINLSYNKFTIIQADEMQFTSQNDVYLDFTYNNISVVNLNVAETIATNQFEFLTQEEKEKQPVTHVTIENNPINCDCRVYSLLQYFEDRLAPEVKYILDIIPGNVKCAEPDYLVGELVTNVPSKIVTCQFEKPNIQDCPEQCRCFFRPSDKALIIDCEHSNLTSLPRALPDTNFSNNTELILSGNKIKSVTSPLGPGYPKVIKCILSNNTITDIDITAFSPRIKILELDGNNITHLNQSSIEFLKQSKFIIKIGLHRNPWKCDCNAKELVHLLQAQLKKVKLLNNITCENGKPLLQMSENDLCPLKTIIIVGGSLTIAVLGLLFGALGALYYRYQREIRVWLYAHHYCLWLVTEHELDQDKLYDAFVSYSHQDEDFVADHLVPGLENGPTVYKLCLHYRNWVAGEYIPTQIARSVEDSRRTIVVLSPNFLESVWGRMEFRAAHKQALSEGRVRVIVILYGDIGPTDNLDTELKAYLTMNTYVKWGDPWFWDKLRYALPHPQALRKGIPLQEKRKPTLKLTDKSGLMNGTDPNASPPAITTPPANSLIINPMNHINGQIKTLA